MLIATLSALLVAGCVVPGVDFDAFEIACEDGADCPEGYDCIIDTCALPGAQGGGGGDGGADDPGPPPDVGGDGGGGEGPDPEPSPEPDPDPEPDPEAEPDPEELDVARLEGVWHFWGKDASARPERVIDKGSFNLLPSGRVGLGGGELFTDIVGGRFESVGPITGGGLDITDHRRREFEATLSYPVGDAQITGTISADFEFMTGTFVSPIRTEGPFLAQRVVAGPGWVCHAGFSGGSDGCDCGCGGIDPDCGGGGCTTSGCTADACEVCFDGLVSQACD